MLLQCVEGRHGVVYVGEIMSTGIVERVFNPNVAIVGEIIRLHMAGVKCGKELWKSNKSELSRV